MSENEWRLEALETLAHRLKTESESPAMREYADDVLWAVGRISALAARVAALEGALRPAWEADEGATTGKWRVIDRRYIADQNGMVIMFSPVSYGVAAPNSMSPATLRLAAAAVNAVRAARAALGGEEGRS